MFEVWATNRLVLFAPTDPISGRQVQKRCHVVAQTIHDGARASLMIEVNLAAGAFQISVVIQQLESSQNLLRAPSNQRQKLGRIQKAVQVNESNHLMVTLRQMEGCRRGDAPEAGQTLAHSNQRLILLSTRSRGVPKRIREWAINPAGWPPGLP